MRVSEKCQAAAFLPGALRDHIAAAVRPLAVPMCQIHPHAAQRGHAEKRHIPVKIVISAHAQHGQPGKNARKLVRILRMVTQMQDRVGLFALGRIGHRDIIAM